jgi:hypothetical protein
MIWVGSGHGMDPKVTPIYRRGGDGGGSFFSSPFILVDGTYQPIFTIPIGNAFRFLSDNDGRLTTREAGLGAFVGVTGPLQFFEDLPVAAPPATGWKVRLSENISGGPGDFETSPAGFGTGDSEGIWFTIGGGATWYLFNTAPTQFSNTSVYELALADEIVKARATLTLGNDY